MTVGGEDPQNLRSSPLQYSLVTNAMKIVAKVE